MPRLPPVTNAVLFTLSSASPGVRRPSSPSRSRPGQTALHLLGGQNGGAGVVAVAVLVGVAAVDHVVMGVPPGLHTALHLAQGGAVTAAGVVGVVIAAVAHALVAVPAGLGAAGGAGGLSLGRGAAIAAAVVSSVGGGGGGQQEYGQQTRQKRGRDFFQGHGSIPPF